MDDRQLTTKEREQIQLRADVEAFLQNGGQIQTLPPGMHKRDTTVTIPEEKGEDDGDL